MRTRGRTPDRGFLPGLGFRDLNVLCQEGLMGSMAKVWASEGFLCLVGVV